VTRPPTPAPRAAVKFTDSRPGQHANDALAIVSTTDAPKSSACPEDPYRTIESMKLTRMVPRDGRDA